MQSGRDGISVSHPSSSQVLVMVPRIAHQRTEQMHDQSNMTENRRNERLNKDVSSVCGRPAAWNQGIFMDETDLTLKDFNKKRTEIRRF